MRLITVESRETVESLADRAYADLTPESRRVAVEALRKANPQLRIGEALKPGMVVQVPDVPGLKPGPDTNAQDPAKDVLALLSNEISDYSKYLAGRLANGRVVDKALDAAGDSINHTLYQTADRRLQQNLHTCRVERRPAAPRQKRWLLQERRARCRQTGVTGSTRCHSRHAGGATIRRFRTAAANDGPARW
jgi:hypothetical protein